MENPSTVRKALYTIIIFFVAYILVFFFSLYFGGYNIPFKNIFRYCFGLSIPQEQYFILHSIRMPRFLTATLTGVALSIAGVAFQGILQNPLADPYLIGTSSGATFGALIYFVFLSSVSNLGLTTFAFFGSVLASFLTYFISMRNGRTSSTRLILSGVVTNSLFSAFSTYLIIFRWRDVQRINFWIFGSFSNSYWSNINILAPIVGISFFLLFITYNSLNIMSLGEEKAIQTGLNVKAFRIYVFLVASLVTATAVSFSGIIGFVGLMIPHIARFFVGPNHKILFPVSAIIGAIFLPLCDILSRVSLYPAEIPIGIITSIIGGIFFIGLLKVRSSYDE